MLDLDGFKMINDTHGHAVGDKTLSEFAHRITAILRADSVLARIGGDEFAIVMPRTDSLDDPTNLARRIAAAVAEPFVIGNVSVQFGVGIGIAIAPNDGSDPEELLRRADRALYRAKGAGRSSVRFFEPEMDTHVERRIQMSESSEAQSRLALSCPITSRSSRLTATPSSGSRRWRVGKARLLGTCRRTYLFPSRKKPVSSTCLGISFCAARVSTPTRGPLTSSSPSTSRPFNCAIRRPDCAFYRILDQLASAHGAWRLRSPRARLWEISGTLRP
jgi:diguanylate cyclase (GGDEF)-like protein